MHQIGKTVGLTGIVLVAALALACTRGGAADDVSASRARSRGGVRPGITVLLEDSAGVIAGKRIGLLTNQTGIDERGRSDIDLLNDAGRTKGARLVALFSPEHGIRGTEDRSNIASGRDERTGLPLHSLYGATTLEPPDSTLRGLDVLVIDLQDLGSRTWTYPSSMVYAMRAAARNRVRVVVLDRPNPVTGTRVEGPILDSAQTYGGSHQAGRRAQPVSLHPIPLRHGLTMGELARYYNEAMRIGADLTVIPADGWRRSMWFDETGLPWVKPSPNMPSLASATMYVAIVPFEASNLSVGRGTADAFQHIGAPWLDAKRVVDLLEDRAMPGVRFEAERAAAVNPTDGKYGGIEMPWVRVVVTDRERAQPVRVGAALAWAVAKVNGDSLRLRDEGFDERLGPPRVREALLRGEDPDSVLDRELPATVEWERSVRKYRLYR